MSEVPNLVPATLGPQADLARRVLAMESAEGIPQWMLHIMEHAEIEHLAGTAPGSYACNPEQVYLACQKAAGTCFIDQWIPRNPLTMGPRGYESMTERGAMTGAERIVCDGIVIDSPEAVVEHMEQFTLPHIREQTQRLARDAEKTVTDLLAGERRVQELFGPNLLKVPYGGFCAFPVLRYWQYGYENYFMAYALYPEVMERDFAASADWARAYNTLAARAIREGRLPAVVRLDHDMADSRGTLVDIRSLDRLWLPHFARAVEPLVSAGVRLLWHCDGNLMILLPRLIEAGVSGFQGFQYEDGMDYPAICRMTDRDGQPLMIWAGVSVTTTLPHGTPDDIRRELRYLVEHGPKVGLCLGCSSSVAPGVPRRNLHALVEGLNYYRTHGRRGL